MNKKTIYNYLNMTISDSFIESLIDECIEEVKSLSHFKVTYQCFHLTHNPLTIKETGLLFNSSDLSFYLKDCNECMIIAGTLGNEVDRKLKYYEYVHMSKALVFDAVCNAYIEQCLDEYQSELPFVHTYRFAPGYGDVPLELNKEFYNYLDAYKHLGLSINNGGLFIPLKSIIGICGIGISSSKSCMSCIKKQDCVYRKEGRRCYVKD